VDLPDQLPDAAGRGRYHPRLFPGFFEAVRALAGAADAREPDPSIHCAYQRKRRRYLALVEALQGYGRRAEEEEAAGGGAG
jgi:hypothetical protein